MKQMFVAMLGVVLAACASNPPQPARPPLPGPRLTIHVYRACDTPAAMLSGVAISAVTADGREVSLGSTHAGAITLEKARLRAEHARLLLFSLKYSETVVLRIDEQDLYAFDEYFVDLPMMVYR